MTDILSLDEGYSTTRLLTKEKPKIINTPEDKFETVLFLPEGENRKGEGGLRTKGYFKKSYDDKPLISIITVVFNGEKYLEETIQSVINQTYSNVEYIIIDGGSSDGTLDIIKKYEERIDYWVSEKDRGMYDAVAKGFSLLSGNYIGYINAGDYYHKEALGVVFEVFKKQNVSWLTGQRVLYNSRSQVINSDVPSRYRKNFILSGIYGSIMPYIQQESTFWKKEVLKTVNLNYFRKLKLSGDYYLWFSFASEYELFIVNSYLGGFKYHENQLSSSIKEYHNEKNKYTKKIFFIYYPFILIDAIIWFLPTKIKQKICKNFINYNKEKDIWE